jgi:hypothetical protein
MKANRPKIFVLPAAIMLATLISSPSARDANSTLGLSEAITNRFSTPAELTDAEKPLLKFATKFTQWAALGKRSSRFGSSYSRTVRLDDDTTSTECEPTPVERFIADGFPTGVQRLHVEFDPTTAPRYSYTLANYAARTPESDPRFVSSPRLAAIEDVAMRFRDEGRFVSGVTYTR